MAQNTGDIENPENEDSQSETSDSNIPQESKLPAEFDEVLETIPKAEQKKIMAIIAMTIKRSSFRGPIPPPEILKGYNDIIPNGAERILRMAEDQSQHRMGIEKSTISEQQRQSSKGQNFAIIIGILGILATVFMAYTGHDTVAGIFGTTTIVGLVGAFVYGRHVQAKGISEK